MVIDINRDAQLDATGIRRHAPCIFRKAVLAHGAVCELAERRAHAESETITCSTPRVHATCQTFHELLRAKSVFALKLRQPSTTMSHALAMKLEFGGLRGLQLALGIEAAIPDVQKLLAAAQVRFGSPECLPFEQIVVSIVHWQGRSSAKSRSVPTNQP